MAKCFSCGSDVSDDAMYCPHCGAKQTNNHGTETADAPSEREEVDSQFQPSPNASSTEGQETSSSSCEFDSAHTGHAPLHRKRLVAVCSIVAVAAIVAAIVFVVMDADKVSNETLKSTLEQSSIVENGVGPPRYVEPTEYKIKNLKITDQKITTAAEAVSSQAYISTGTSDTNTPLSTVSYKATIENENFSSEIEGTVQFLKRNDRWVAVASPSSNTLLTYSTKPLKGVSKIDNVGLSLFLTDSSDFEATLNENEGSFFSTASEKVTYEYWFAKDSATVSQNYKFDQKKGWLRVGDPQLSNQETTWTLEGKTFKYDNAAYTKTTVALSFKSCSSDSLVADHSVIYTPSDGLRKCDYVDVNISGEAKGKPIHTFGTDQFSVEMSDGENRVIYKIDGTTASKTAIANTIYALDASVDTDFTYRKSANPPASQFKISGIQLVEQV